ncbi:MAG: phosphotransferase family protein [Actinomycetota bacterium]
MRSDQREALVQWLRTELGWAVDADVRIARIGTGHSRAMLRVEVDGTPAAVVRLEQGGVFGTSGVEECRVMGGLAAAGFPVAQIIADEPTGSLVGFPFFVMAFIAGAELADERAFDEPTAASFVTELARLHRLDTAVFDDPAYAFDLRPTSPSDATPIQIERWRGAYRAASARPIPLLEEAAAWLHRHAPPLERLSVVHGDAGPGNVVHAGGEVVAVTDWEFAHLGDPAEDWSFCLTMRGGRTMPRDAWLALYAEHAGVVLSDEQWRYWEAFNLFKGACANRTCLTLFTSGVNRAPNMAIIGTVLHEVFLRRLADLITR